MAKEVPTKFGKCKVQRLLGRGATAVVYLAKHEGLDIPVAVKVLRRKLSEKKPQYADRFLREARMAARLEHSNIVRVIDCGVEAGHHYMVMDYVDGPNCLELLKKSPGGMDWRQATEIMRQAAVGLAYAAEQDVIHRDVKPSNIMLDSTGRARVSDLGLAKLTIKGMASLTQELHTVGTPNYMSPEQVRSPSELDLRADIYSLGGTLYHMVCGRPPFTGKSSMEVVAQHLSAPLVAPFKRKPNLPRALSFMICKMMAKSPEERYQNYEELLQDVDDFLAGKEIKVYGFEETRVGFQDEAELHRVLDELAFGDAIKVEDEELPEEVRELSEAAEGATAGASSSELTPFTPDEFLSYEPVEPQPDESTALVESRPEQSRTDVRLVIAVVILAGVVVLVAAVIFAILAGS